MGTAFQPVTQPTLPCKCCGGSARIFGVVDFNKNSQIRVHVLDPCGIPIYYHRCLSCGFIFTTALDDFSPQDFAKWIYDEKYPLLDPEYAEKRPRDNAQFLLKSLGAAKDIKILDYGGGNGKLGQLLREGGFRSVTTFDPFVAEHSKRPEGRHDLVLCFEAVEHSPQPRQTFTEIDQLLEPDGMVIFSTLFQPPTMQEIGVGWWYIGPRNGHVSIFTRQAMNAIVGPLGLKLGSFSDGAHVLFRQPPAFAQHLFQLAKP